MRKENPDLFLSQWMNRLWYGAYGFFAMFAGLEDLGSFGNKNKQNKTKASWYQLSSVV
jgi:hypothetical protein